MLFVTSYYALMLLKIKKMQHTALFLSDDLQEHLYISSKSNPAFCHQSWNWSALGAVQKYSALEFQSLHYYHYVKVGNNKRRDHANNDLTVLTVWATHIWKLRPSSRESRERKKEKGLQKWDWDATGRYRGFVRRRARISVHWHNQASGQLRKNVIFARQFAPR